LTLGVVVRRVLPMLGALAVGAAALSLAPRGSLGPPWVLAALACGALAWVLWQPVDGRRDDVLPALAVMLSALGLAAVARISSDLAHRQLLWLAFSLAVAIALGPAFNRFRVLSGYRYIWVLGSVILFALVALFGEEVNGARLWIRVGSVQFEPIEIIKLFIVLFMAGYLAQTADVIAAARPWSLRANAKYLGPLFLGWGISTAILVFEHDIGMAALLFLIFIAILYVATRRLDLVIGASVVFVGAVAAAVRFFPYVAARIDVWLHPDADPLGRGYQALQGLFSLDAGGLFGTGYGLGHPTYIPSVATDYIYSAWSEEFGALGAIALLAAYLLVVRRALLVAQRAPDLYAKLLATGLAATLGFQVFIIVSGVLGLFPLTGITLPFFSYGGSSLVANYLLIAALWAIGGERPVQVAA
jgi:cell division protein FtsW (lipid II flippase)